VSPEIQHWVVPAFVLGLTPAIAYGMYAISGWFVGWSGRTAR